MGQASNIVLADAQATPVNHTFVPVGPRKDGFILFEDMSATSPIGFNMIAVRMRRVKQGSSNAAQSTTRINIELRTPKLETLATNSSGFTPPPTVAYVPVADVSFAISDRSVLQDRKDIRKFLHLLLNEAQIVNMIENQVAIY
jgi:hypothetical protein